VSSSLLLFSLLAQRFLEPTPPGVPVSVTALPAVFDAMESEVRSYCRTWPVVFDRARGARLYDEQGRSWLDFFAGAGALNYGHNHPRLQRALLEYLQRDGVVHALDMATGAKQTFLERFDEVVLRPRGLDYKVQFPGPTGTNAVEAALKLARKVTGREAVVGFTNAFHGMTLGALAVTGNSMKRAGAGIPLVHATPMPYDNYLGGRTPDFLWFETLLADSGSGLNKPAAVIVETVQGEGGINVARPEWLRGLADLCRRHEILLIVDDVQMGCGRTGPFFSFEAAGITPDIVCLSKSISGFGLPMALTLLRRDLDVWAPGEHNGTFRGHNPAFVTATAALEFWRDDALEKDTLIHGERIGHALTELAREHADLGAQPRGIGLVRGLGFADPTVADRVIAHAFGAGLLVESSGPRGEVVKLMPPLTATAAEIDEGLEILTASVRAAAAA
jgi:diaminobutyrate-2-oxoglutarate transaminase